MMDDQASTPEDIGSASRMKMNWNIQQINFRGKDAGNESVSFDNKICVVKKFCFSLDQQKILEGFVDPVIRMKRLYF